MDFGNLKSPTENVAGSRDELSIANCQLLIVNESLPILARGAEFVFRIAYCVLRKVMTFYV